MVTETAFTARHLSFLLDAESKESERKIVEMVDLVVSRLDVLAPRLSDLLEAHGICLRITPLPRVNPSAAPPSVTVSLSSTGRRPSPTDFPIVLADQGAQQPAAAAAGSTSASSSNATTGGAWSWDPAETLASSSLDSQPPCPLADPREATSMFFLMIRFFRRMGYLYLRRNCVKVMIFFSLPHR